MYKYCTVRPRNWDSSFYKPYSCGLYSETKIVVILKLINNLYKNKYKLNQII